MKLTNTGWGWFPILAPVAALGVLLTSLSMGANISGQPYAMLLFWAGVLVIILPVGYRLCAREHYPFNEALALVILVGVALFLVSILRQLIQNSPYDAYLHWRTASDILTTRHLFTFNNMLPVSPYYPGLEVVATAMVNLTGLPIFTAGIILTFTARLIMVISLFLILADLGGSLRVAGLGSLVYMGSSTFVYFDTQFAYQSLSLPLIVTIIWLLHKRSQMQGGSRIPAWNDVPTQPVNEISTKESRSPLENSPKGAVILAVLTGLMVGITHHLMSYFMVGLLILWTGAGFIRNFRSHKEYAPTWITLILGIFVLAWLFFVAEITVGYLAPYVGATFTTLLRFISGYRGDRSLLPVNQSVGITSERVIAIASVIVIMLGEAWGLWVWWRRRNQYKPLLSGLAMLLFFISLIYPLLPLLHLNNNTWEVADRLASIIFIGLALVIGLGLVTPPSSLQNFKIWRLAFLFAIGLIICAGIIGGSNPNTRLPGPYMVEADSRSLDSFGLAAADWAASTLGPNNRMASDRSQSILMGSLGKQSMIFGSSDGFSLSPIFLKPELGPGQIRDIESKNIQYLVIDRRITQSAPLFGYYFDNWEQQIDHFAVPVDPKVLDKFDHTPGVVRVFDNGYIQIYSLGGLLDVSQTH